jgi:hypothetical protein
MLFNYSIPQDQVNTFLSVLRSRMIFMRLRFRVKILMQCRLRRLRLRLLSYCVARQKFENELKLKQMLKLQYLVHLILYDLY